MAELNAVETTVNLAGQKVHFSFLRLVQKFNKHHYVEIHIDHEEFGDLWMDEPTIMIKYIGDPINITMKHKQGEGENLFSGIVTNVSFTGYHGSQNSIIITGASPTIKLDGKPAMDSFMDLPLQQVVQESVSNSGNGGSVTANPKFGSKLDYVCQYNESCWEFLNRLSWQFGEWFFYDGQECCFGLKYGKDVRLEYDKEMTYFDLSANLAPSKTTLRHFLKHDSKEIDKEDPSDVPGVRGYLQVSKNRSESIYTSDITTQIIPDVNTKKDLDDLAKAEKSRAVGGMLIMRGQTQTCKVKIGGVVNVKLPATLKLAVTDVDRFLVTQVTHTVDQEGHYSNSFEGIIDGIEVIPMTEPKIPIANPQIATVKENVEPRERGLVKVQFQWQKPKNKTSNWIRVQTPDAGKSDIVPQNRGFVFIPEKDDTVMIGFEYGDPSRPFVMGSIFSEKISKGGGVDDNIKTIITRSGHTIKFDDTKGKEKIQIYDKKKNLVEIDTLENTISVNALNIINLNAVDVNITAKNSCTIAAGASIVATTPGIVEIAGATKASVSSMNVAVSALSGVAVSGNKSITMKSGTGSNLSMDAKGQGTFNAKKRLKVTSDNQIDVSAKKQTKVESKKTLIEGKSVAAIKGSKVQVR